VFLDLLEKAIEMDIVDKLWEKWLVELPNMDKETFIPFDEYKNKHFKRQKQAKADEEVLQDARKILLLISRPR